MNFYAIDFGHTNYKIAFIENGNVVNLDPNDPIEVNFSMKKEMQSI